MLIVVQWHVRGRDCSLNREEGAELLFIVTTIDYNMLQYNHRFSAYWHQNSTSRCNFKPSPNVIQSDAELYHQRLINRSDGSEGSRSHLYSNSHYALNVKQKLHISCRRRFIVHGHGIRASTSCPGCLPYNNSTELHHCCSLLLLWEDKVHSFLSWL